MQTNTKTQQFLENNIPDVSQRYLRPLENTGNGAANQQAELLGKKYPGNLTKCWVCLTLQVQNRRSKESNAESKAEENTPVCQCVMGIPFKQSYDPLIHKHLGNNKDEYLCEADYQGFLTSKYNNINTWQQLCEALWMLVVVYWVSWSLLKLLASSSSLDCLTKKVVLLS